MAQGEKIVICEDYQDLLETLTDRLTHEGYNVVAIQPGTDPHVSMGAVLDDLAKNRDAFAAVFDFHYVDFTLASIVRSIQEAGWAWTSPIVVASGKDIDRLEYWTDPKEIVYLKKPFKTATLLETLRGFHARSSSL